MLKNRWQNAICRAFWRSLVLSFAIAAIIPVVVVPMFAPSVSGYIRSMLTTPTPTRGVMADVKIELDWTKIVRPMPMTMAMYPVKYLHFPGNSALMNFFIPFLMFPWRSEFRVLTMANKQMQRRARASTRRMAPRAPSLSPSLKAYSPTKDICICVPWSLFYKQVHVHQKCTQKHRHSYIPE